MAYKLFNKINSKSWSFYQILMGLDHFALRKSKFENGYRKQGTHAGGLAQSLAHGNVKQVIIIIYHYFHPTPRRGSHVKSGKTHTHSHQDTPLSPYT